VVDDAIDTAAGVSGVSSFTSVVTGNDDDAASTADETCPLTAVSESSSIDGHEVPEGTLLSLSFSAFRASCLLHTNNTRTVNS